jgi:uncharacterized protein YbaA (DUF1428 family)
MSYVDGFVLPVPKDKLAAYRTMARKAGKVWMEYGALAYCECVEDDVKPGRHTSFPQSVKLKPGEVVVFAWIVYRSRAARQGQREGDGRPAHRRDGAAERDAVRRQAHVLGRFQADRDVLSACLPLACGHRRWCHRRR